jgi:hypothetical protein
VYSNGSTLFLAGSTRVSRFALGGTPQPIEGIPASKLPWEFGLTSPQSNLVLTNGSGTAYALAADGPFQAVAMPDPVNVASATWGPQGLFFGARSVSDATPGGIYASASVQATPQRVAYVSVNDVTYIAPTPVGFLYGTSAGHVIACDATASRCGVDNPIGVGRVDGFAVNPRIQTQGYALTADGVYRSVIVDPSTGQITGAIVINAETAGVTIEGQYYRHAIAADNQCVYFTSSQGVHWANDSGLSGLLYATPAGGPVLGLAVPGEVVFTVFAPSSQGGGLYQVARPTQCGGTGTGTGVPSADGGSGGSSSGGTSGAVCKQPGATCAAPSDCCTGFCNGNFCTTASCQADGQPCDSSPMCCGNNCVNFVCQPLKP